MSFPQVLPHYDNSVVVTSHAKDLALPGERIGYIAVNPNYAGKEELSAGLSFCNRTLGFVNAPALMQHIVRNLQGVSVDAGYYEKKRDYLCQHLGELGYDVVKPQGAFYLYPKAPVKDDVVFCKTLLNSNVLVVPGRGFGTPTTRKASRGWPRCWSGNRPSTGPRSSSSATSPTGASSSTA